jgi:hypothetical protein
MLAIVAAMALIPAQRIPLVFGIVSVIILLVAYALRHAFGSRPPDVSRAPKRNAREDRG